jgi:hypothetical protein
MQASYHIAILSAQEVERHVQERIRTAEREHLLRSFRQNRPNRFRSVRAVLGGLVERFGRKISGSTEASERWIDVPNAVGQSR